MFASTKCSMIGPWEAKVEGGVHSRMRYDKQQEYMKSFKVEDDMYSICYKLGFYCVGFGQFVNIFLNFIIMIKKLLILIRKFFFEKLIGNHILFYFQNYLLFNVLFFIDLDVF